MLYIPGVNLMQKCKYFLKYLFQINYAVGRSCKLKLARRNSQHLWTHICSVESISAVFRQLGGPWVINRQEPTTTKMSKGIKFIETSLGWAGPSSAQTGTGTLFGVDLTVIIMQALVQIGLNWKYQVALSLAKVTDWIHIPNMIFF